MSRFAKINEDPSYDDDYAADDDWATAPIDIDESELDELGIDKDNFNPYSTVNS